MGKSKGAGRAWICQKSLSGMAAISTDMGKRGGDVSDTLMIPQHPPGAPGPVTLQNWISLGRTDILCLLQAKGGWVRRQSESHYSLKIGNVNMTNANEEC